MPDEKFQRDKAGFKYVLGGLNVKNPPDTLLPGKYAVLQNLRSTSDNTMLTRPGFAQLPERPVLPGFITSLNTYANIGGLTTPTFSPIAVYKAGATVFTTQQGATSLVADNGYASGLGAAMIPYRPNQSTNPWMYIGDANQYRKISVPDPDTTFIQKANVGIIEPQPPVDAVLSSLQQSFVGLPADATSWAAGGTAGSTTTPARVTDTAVGVFPDPAGGTSTVQIIAAHTAGVIESVSGLPDGSITSARANFPVTFTGTGTGATGFAVVVFGVVDRDPPHITYGWFIAGVQVTNGGTGYTSGFGATTVSGGVLPGGLNVHVGAATTARNQYQKMMAVIIDGDPFTVQDVFSPIPEPIACTGIYYYAGTTGRCVISLPNLTTGAGNEGQSLNNTSFLTSLRRGALIRMSGEVCFILGVSVGPDGSIAFETTTASNHLTGEFVEGIPAFSVIGVPAASTAISSDYQKSTITVGVGTLTATTIISPFASPTAPYQPSDLIHLSIRVSALANLLEGKILFDVNNGSANFTDNVYYYSFRPSDIQEGIANTATQLTIAQQLGQYALLGAESAAHGGPGQVQTVAGHDQWSEIVIPISALSRVGNDQTRTLLDCQAIQILFNCTGTLDASINSFGILGGYSTDVGETGAPYMYRIRPRSTVTGAKGNPSPRMRYGVSPRRAQVTIPLPTTYIPDLQVDTWDIFRSGGSLLHDTYVGSVPLGTASYLDTYGDDALAANDLLEFDNLQPWPSVDVPFQGVASVTGHTALVSVSSSGSVDITRYLPGNLVRIDQRVYTLWCRPTLASADPDIYLFQFQENAGSISGAAMVIYEPDVANQVLPYIWGPSAEGGVLFACGDPLRPGTVYFAKNFNPDSAPNKYNLEICPPSEPLLGGEVLEGKSFVASSNRWWALYPAFNSANRFTPVETPVGRGLVGSYGHCTDGKLIYFWAEDGIYAHSGGVAISLTDEDLYPLFPHGGAAGTDTTYGPYTIAAPDYGHQENFRLAVSNSYLYADYTSPSGAYHTLTFDLKRKAWSVEVPYDPARRTTIHCRVDQPSGSSGTIFPSVFSGDVSGRVYTEKSSVNDGWIDTVSAGDPIPCAAATAEWDAGDNRAPEIWGDVYFDSYARALITITPYSLGQPLPAPATPQTIPATFTRTQLAISLGGGIESNYLGLLTEWAEDFITTPGPTNAPTQLYTWQPSFVPKPEVIGDRFQDWDDAGATAAKFVQGFVLEANTYGADKVIAVRDADTGALQQTFTINHNGQQEKAYSFPTPFISHRIRIEPQDQIRWQLFQVRWVWEPTPETVLVWQTQGTAHGNQGFMHVRQITVAHLSSADLLLTVTVDGIPLAPQTIPNSAGQYMKTFVPLPPNKGRIYNYRIESIANFQIYQEDLEVMVGGWNRQVNPYADYPLVGGTRGDQAKI